LAPLLLEGRQDAARDPRRGQAAHRGVSQGAAGSLRQAPASTPYGGEAGSEGRGGRPPLTTIAAGTCVRRSRIQRNTPRPAQPSTIAAKPSAQPSSGGVVNEPSVRLSSASPETAPTSRFDSMSRS